MRPNSRPRIRLRTGTCRPGHTVLSPETEPHARFAPTLRSPRRLFYSYRDTAGRPSRTTLTDRRLPRDGYTLQDGTILRRLACVAMMEPANHGHLDDSALVGVLHRSRLRGVLLQ